VTSKSHDPHPQDTGCKTCGIFNSSLSSQPKKQKKKKNLRPPAVTSWKRSATLPLPAPCEKIGAAAYTTDVWDEEDATVIQESKRIFCYAIDVQDGASASFAS
jgi:hypothetical protein